MTVPPPAPDREPEHDDRCCMTVAGATQPHYDCPGVVGRERPVTLLRLRARAIAVQAHHGQVDKCGEPYITHPERVAASVRADLPGDYLAESVAWLHDVVEDTDVTLDDLRFERFPERVIEAVDAISKRTGESFADYYERVKANPLALVVKWHDIADNADPARLAKVAPDTRDRLRAKYERAHELLKAAI